MAAVGVAGVRGVRNDAMDKSELLRREFDSVMSKEVHP
jgi:hypothetical protein